MSEANDAVALATMKDIEKDFGKGSLMMLGNATRIKVDVIPTGILPVDRKVIGVGGIPKGRLTEIIGPESSGKTTMALNAIAEAQQRGETAAFIDVEHALDAAWATRLGVDVNKLFVAQPDFGEQALQIAERLIDSKAFGLIVIDSVAALSPRAEIEGEIGDATVGALARLMSQCCRKFVPAVGRANCAVVFINQIREKIGVMFGSPETTPGGRALRFYSSLRLDVRRAATLKHGEDPIGIAIKVKAIKNKLSAPFGEEVVNLYFETGIDKITPIIETAVEAGLIVKSGAWYTIGAERFQGKDAVAKFLAENHDTTHSIVNKLTS